jgi:cell division protease FtsH
MSGEIEQEVDADDLHEESKKITLSDIKLALQKRFRNEQIARLGNIHIIYPSLNKKSYEQIIGCELEKASQLLLNQAGVKLDFCNALLDKIYEEGVSPAQGTRPVFSTIHLWVRGQLGKMLTPIVERGLNPDCILLDYNNKAVQMEYQKSGEIIHKDSYSPYSFNDRARENKEPGLRYIVAIHEAGHIITSIKLLNHIPKNATSLSVSSRKDGFVSIQRPKSYYEKDIKNWLATLLSGGVAEKQVFGRQHVPMGTGEDHQMATNFILNLLKSGALGETPGMYFESGLGGNNLKDDQNIMTKIAEEWLRKSQALAKETLLRFEKPLVCLAEQLLDKNYLNRDDLTEFASVHLNHHIIEDPFTTSYEESFKQKLASYKDERI